MDGSRAEVDGQRVVYVVDGDISFRQLLGDIVRRAGWQPFLFASAREFLSHERTLCPSCLVLEVILPDLSGLDLQMLVACERADLPIIFVTDLGDVPMTVRAMKAGAVEVLTKPVEAELMTEVIRSALDQSLVTQKASAEVKELQDRYALLSAREREVMELVVLGLMNKQVGCQLGISEITVKAHRGRVMRKMEARSLVDLVNMEEKLQRVLSVARERSSGRANPVLNANEKSSNWRNKRYVPKGAPSRVERVDAQVPGSISTRETDAYYEPKTSAVKVASPRMNHSDFRPEVRTK